jgi:hypothetical protein
MEVRPGESRSQSHATACTVVKRGPPMWQGLACFLQILPGGVRPIL